MGNYGKAAVKAVRLIAKGKRKTAPDAWNASTIALFGVDTASQKKSCPRAAFLGLCESGLVQGIPARNYTQSVANKSYAVAAVRLLKSKPSLIAINNTELWKRVMKDLKKPITKTHYQQMDVVRALYPHHLL